MNDPWTWLRTLFRFPTPAGFLPAGSLPVAWLPAGSAPGSVPLEAPGGAPRAGWRRWFRGLAPGVVRGAAPTQLLCVARARQGIVWRISLGLTVAALGCSAALAEAPTDCPATPQPISAEEAAAGAANARDHGFLWRVIRREPAGLDASASDPPAAPASSPPIPSAVSAVSYLYGTVHVARREWVFPGPTISEALRGSDVIALELDLLDPEVRQRMSSEVQGQPDRRLPEALRERIERQAVAECLPAQVLAAYSPEMQIAALTALVGRRDGLDPAYGIDLFLAAWGRAAGKTMVSLETPHAQLSALQAPTLDETIGFVEKGLDDIQSGRAAPTLRRIAQVWADSDLDTLASYEAWCNCVNSPADHAAMKRLLDDRNLVLADTVAGLIDRDQRVFAAVGSLHMVGPLSVPALLAQRGYTVERILLVR